MNKFFRIYNEDSHIVIFFCFIKFKFRKYPKNNLKTNIIKIFNKNGSKRLKKLSYKYNFKIIGTGNKIILNEKLLLKKKNLKIDISGNNNKIYIDYFKNESLKIRVNGNTNKIKFGKMSCIDSEVYITGDNHSLSVAESEYYLRFTARIGQDENNKKTNNCRLVIGQNCYIGNCNFYLYQNNNSITIGEDCMISTDVIIQTNDGHKIIDKITNEICNNKNNIIKIGKHVWIGRRAYILKSVDIPDGCIIGACSLVNKSISTPNSAVAGIPAKIIRENIEWERDVCF